MCRYLLIVFVSEGLLFIQLPMQVVNRRCLHPVKLPLSYRSIHIDWVFHSRLALIYEYLLRALLVLFESADSVIMFGGLG